MKRKAGPYQESLPYAIILGSLWFIPRSNDVAGGVGD